MRSPAISACRLDIEDWEKIGHEVPLLVNMQPAGKYLGEEFHRAGGVPAVVNELMKKKLIHKSALTVNGKSIGENCKGKESGDPDVIFPIDKPLKPDAGFIVLHGNLFDSAIMKTSVIDEEFRKRYLSNPRIPTRSRAAPSCSKAPRIITTGSTTRSSRSTSIACCSFAARGRSAIPAARKW